MKYLVLAILLVFVVYLSSCKKYIQQQEENAIVAAVTNGLWFVEDYMQNDSDITTTFSGYLFKFDANGTVTGTKDSLSVKAPGRRMSVPEPSAPTFPRSVFRSAT